MKSLCEKTLIFKLDVGTFHFYLDVRRFFIRLDNNVIVIGILFRRNRLGLRRKHKCLYAMAFTPI